MVVRAITQTRSLLAKLLSLYGRKNISNTQIEDTFKKIKSSTCNPTEKQKLPKQCIKLYIILR